MTIQSPKELKFIFNLENDMRKVEIENVKNEISLLNNKIVSLNNSVNKDISSLKDDVKSLKGNMDSNFQELKNLIMQKKRKDNDS